MLENTFNINNKITPNNNNILQEIINDINQLMNYSKDNFILKSLVNIIDKINYMFSENKKNLELTRNYNINTLDNKFSQISINPKTIQEIKVKDGKYIGKCVNGIAGKEICYFINGDRYEGNMKNNIKEGKGIYYFINGDRYEGDFRNNLKD